MRVFYVAFFESGIRQSAGPGKTHTHCLISSSLFNDMRAGTTVSRNIFTVWNL